MDILLISYLFLFLLFIAGLIYGGGLAIRTLARHWFSQQMLLITVPHERQQSVSFNHASGMREYGVTIEILKRLHEQHISCSLEIAVPAIGEELHCYVVVQKRDCERLKQIVTAFIPAAIIQSADNYDLWLDGTEATGRGLASTRDFTVSYIEQVKPYAIPLKPLKNANLSPFWGILRVFSSLKTLGEGAVLQLIVKPAHPAISERISKMINSFSVGRYHTSPLIDSNFTLACQTLPILEKKIGEPMFTVTARILTSSPIAKTNHAVFKNLEKYFEVTETGVCYNALTLREVKNSEKHVAELLHRHFNESQQMILNASEVATLFQFPMSHTAAAKMKQ